MPTHVLLINCELVDLKQSKETLDQWLPIIYNPYAEITPMTPYVVNSDIIPERMGWRPWWLMSSSDFERKSYFKIFPGEKGFYSQILRKNEYTWRFDARWKAHVEQEEGDISFPQNEPFFGSLFGPKMYVEVLPKLHAYLIDRHIGNRSTGAYPIDSRDISLQVFPEERLVPSTYHQVSDNLHLENLRVNTASDLQFAIPSGGLKAELVPAIDVIYHWDMAYFYYGRTRQKGNDGNVPRYRGVFDLKSPVTLEITTFQQNRSRQWKTADDKYIQIQEKYKGLLHDPDDVHSPTSEGSSECNHCHINSSGTEVFSNFVPATAQASIASLWKVNNSQSGKSSSLWAYVKNTGTLALPSDARVWFYVSGPGYRSWVGSVSAAGLAAQGTRWYGLNWTIPGNTQAGSYNYRAMVW